MNCREPAVVDHWTSRKGLVRQAAVFPSAAYLLVTQPRRSPISTAMLKLQDGTVWLIKARGQAMTRRRIAQAGAILTSGEEKQPGNLAGWRRRLAEHLAIPSLEIADRISLQAVAEQWNIRELSPLPKRIEPQPGKDDSVDAVEKWLAGFHKRLFANLDPQARPYALASGTLDVTVYNHLIHPRYGRYRRQFAETFPLLFPLSTSSANGDGGQVRAIVDSGTPLVRSLAEAWGVAPRVVRYLAGKPRTLIGTHWDENLPGLARILDTLAPEHCPQDEPEQWERFYEAVAHVQRTAGKPAWKSPAALAWLRDSTSLWLGKGSDQSTIYARASSLIPAVSRFREVMEMVLEYETAQRRRDTASGDNAVARPSRIAAELVESYLKGGRLTAYARRLAREIDRARAEEQKSLEIRVMLGESYWPLFSGRYISLDGERRVISLTEDEQFRTHADRMKICLWTCQSYRRRCRRGRSFILAFYDAQSGVPRSTAAIDLIWNVRERRWELCATEHKGYANLSVSGACTHALREILDKCQQPEMQCYIEHGQRVIADAAWVRQQSEKSAYASALRATIGGAAYEAAVERTMANGSVRKES